MCTSTQIQMKINTKELYSPSYESESEHLIQVLFVGLDRTGNRTYPEDALKRFEVKVCCSVEGR